jgi:hypothetical protein
MKRFWLGFLLMAMGAPFPGSLAAEAAPADDSLQQLAGDFWEWRARTQPYSPDDIPRIERPGGKRDWSRGEIEKQRLALEQFETRWKKLDSRTAVVVQQVDYQLLGSALSRVRWEMDINPRWQRDPNFYVEQALAALVEALVVPPPFDKKRSDELLTRIRDIPGIVAAGQENLQNPPAPFAKVAIEALAGVAERLGSIARSLEPLTTLRPGELDEALKAAGTALERYRTWLEPKLPGLPAKTALGREAYVFFLRNVALVSSTPDELVQMGHQEWTRSLAFEAFEEQRNRKLPPLAIAADTESWIRKAAAGEQAIRDFLEANDLLSVPKGVGHYTLRAMPEYLRAVSVYGETDDFTGPSRLDRNGVRYVNPPSRKLGFFWRATAEDPRPITVHEGVPGHYFQLVCSWQHPDPIRRHYYDSSPNEGIGFYAEELLLEAGLFDDSPRTREIIYHFMRLRALRVEVDVKLALGELTLDEAAEELRSKVPMDQETARSEATMFSTTPGQAISYQLGKNQILEFLADARRREGDKFTLRKFHDFLWKNGNVPIRLQRREYLAMN